MCLGLVSSRVSPPNLDWPKRRRIRPRVPPPVGWYSRKRTARPAARSWEGMFRGCDLLRRWQKDGTGLRRPDHCPLQCRIGRASIILVTRMSAASTFRSTARTLGGRWPIVDSIVENLSGGDGRHSRPSCRPIQHQVIWQPRCRQRRIRTAKP